MKINYLHVVKSIHHYYITNWTTNHCDFVIAVNFDASLTSVLSRYDPGTVQYVFYSQGTFYYLYRKKKTVEKKSFVKKILL